MDVQFFNRREVMKLLMMSVVAVSLFLGCSIAFANHEGEQQTMEYEGRDLAVCFTREGAEALTGYFLVGGWELVEKMFYSIKNCELWSGKFIILAQSETMTFGEENIVVTFGLTNRRNEFYFMGKVRE